MIEIGKKYDMLTVIADIGQVNTGKRNRRFYLCRCDCGKELRIRLDQLGKIHSCGCIKKITSAKNARLNHKHKQSGTRLYRIWQNMKARCCNKNNNCYDRYGARGITVCAEWRNGFEKFYNWAMSNGYEADLTIDRIDNDGNYSPNNCRWVTGKEQSLNRSSNVKINGKSLSEIAETLPIKESALRARYKRGDREDILFRDLNIPTGRSRGENNNKAKITEMQAAEIKQLLKEGVSGIEIAKKYNVSKYLISDIKRNRTWKHIK